MESDTYLYVVTQLLFVYFLSFQSFQVFTVEDLLTEARFHFICFVVARKFTDKSHKMS